MTVFTTLTSSNAFMTKKHAETIQNINLEFQNLKQSVESLDIETLSEIQQEFKDLTLDELVTDNELVLR